MEKKSFYLECMDGMHIVRFSKWLDDESVGIDYIVHAFESEQEWFIKKIWNRVRLAVSILFKGEYPLYEVYIKHQDTLKDLAVFLGTPIPDVVNPAQLTLEFETKVS